MPVILRRSRKRGAGTYAIGRLIEPRANGMAARRTPGKNEILNSSLPHQPEGGDPVSPVRSTLLGTTTVSKAAQMGARAYKYRGLAPLITAKAVEDFQTTNGSERFAIVRTRL